MKVHLITPTQISLLDITSMGDSVKRGNDNLIGAFDSGLKYSIALLLRNDVDISIRVPGEMLHHENWEEPSVDIINFSSYIETSSTGKEKELIQLEISTEFLGGGAMSQHDMREPSNGHFGILKTGFAKALGHNWELWMALRELWSNMLDEGGYCSPNDEDYDFQGTVITLTFDEDSEFGKIWENKHLYINEAEPLFVLDNRTEVLDNAEGFLRIYKQNILVFSDEKRPSRYAYNIKFGQLDEKRVLSNIYSIEGEILNSIRNTKNETFLRTIITPDFSTSEKEFLSEYSTYYEASDLVHNLAVEIFEEFGEVRSYAWLISSIKKRRDCRIAGKVIKSVDDSIWTYSTEVKVESKPETISEPDMEVDDVVYSSSFSAEIKKHYNFNLDVEIKTAKLKGSRVIADKFEKCIIVSEDFSVENDFAEFIVQYLDLTQDGNVVTNLSKYIVDLIRK